MNRLLSPLQSLLMSPLVRAWRRLAAPRMVYGLRSGDGEWRPHSRISTHTRIEAPQRLSLGDHVYIGHFNLIDASGGLRIGHGCQITSHVCVLTHSSHRALRLEREAYWGHARPAALVRESTQLGDWCFIGPHSVIAPGSRLGRGVLVKAFSQVRGEVPDFAIVAGQPAQVVGDVRDGDRAWFATQLSSGAASSGSDDAALREMREAYEAWLAGAAGRP